MTVAWMALASIVVAFVRVSLEASMAVTGLMFVRACFEWWHGRAVPLWLDGEDDEGEPLKGRTPRGFSQCVTAGADKPHRVRRFNGVASE